MGEFLGTRLTSCTAFKQAPTFFSADMSMDEYSYSGRGIDESRDLDEVDGQSSTV